MMTYDILYVFKVLFDILFSFKMTFDTFLHIYGYQKRYLGLKFYTVCNIFNYIYLF